MINIKKNISLKKHNTFNIDSKAKYFTEVKSIKELEEAVGYAKTHKLPILIVGRGSNVLMVDKVFNGLVIRLKNDEIKIVKETSDHIYIKVDAGKIWDDLVNYCVDRNYQGIECLSGIPGTVGAAPVQNIGAYGQELADVFVELTAYDLKTCKFVTLDASECKFEYRDSLFKKKRSRGHFIIFNVTLKLHKNLLPKLSYSLLRMYLKDKKINNPTLKQIRNAVLVIRRQKLVDPKEYGNAGSFFKNPIISKEKYERLRNSFPNIPNYPEDNGRIKIPAGWLVEKAGWRGKSYKNVGVSQKHALILINSTGKATAKEVLGMVDKIKNDVRIYFNIELDTEVQIIR
jgi:UDP-N-acetylmuramate dehydrogenase